MRPTRLLAMLAIVALMLGIPAVGNASPRAAAQQEDPSAAAERDMKRQSPGKVTVKRDERGIAHFVGTEPGKPVRRPEQAAANASADKKAAAHLKRYGALWGLEKKGSDARPTKTHPGKGKGSVVRFQQTVDGTPVLGAELAVALDDAGNLQSVSGETTPLSLDPAPRTVSADQAKRTAVQVAARMNKVPAGALRASDPEAYAYDAVLLGASSKAQLAPVWRVEVTGAPQVRHLVLVDRTRGTVPLQFNQVAGALYRVVCDNGNHPDENGPDGYPKAETCVRNFMRTEDDAEPSGIIDVDAAYDYAGDTSDFYGQFGFDLTDLIGNDTGSGKRLRSTVGYCLPSDWDPECSPNAFWNGRGVFYSQGMSRADDVVAHELTHGVVEHNANLFYWYQSGAINESMADVFGELVDLTNADAETEDAWKIGEGSTTGVIRDMKDPAAHGDPDRMRSPNYQGEKVNSDFFDNGGVHRNSGVGNKAAYLIARPFEEGPVVFNGKTITGIGYPKAAQVYYQALKMLTSGADYQDLFGVLPQACRNLVANGVGELASGDCQTVTDAVTATEMDQQPTKNPAPEAPVCDSGTKQNMLLDRIDSTSNWAFTRYTPPDGKTYSMWNRIDYYARSGQHSLYGLEPRRAAGEPKWSYARIPKAYQIPSGVKTYLRFDHQYLLAHWPGDASAPQPEYYAGAALLYSIDGGKSFKSASGLPWKNGPAKRITPWNPDKQQFDSAYTGFGGDSHGYQSSRLDVSSLAGKSVVFRWRITADPDFALDGWTLDDVNLYACGEATPSNVSGLNTIGGLNRATVKWTPPVWKGDGGLTKNRIVVKRDGKTVKWFDVAGTATSTVVTGLSRGVTYRFYVRPYSAGGYGPVVSRQLVGTAHASSLSATTINKGQYVTFKGKLKRVDNGAGIRTTVYLQGRPKGSTRAFSTHASMRSSSYGNYSFKRRPTASWQYRVVYKSGYSTYMGSTSAARTVTVR